MYCARSTRCSLCKNKASCIYHRSYCRSNFYTKSCPVGSTGHHCLNDCLTVRSCLRWQKQRRTTELTCLEKINSLSKITPNQLTSVETESVAASSSVMWHWTFANVALFPAIWILSYQHSGIDDLTTSIYISRWYTPWAVAIWCQLMKPCRENKSVYRSSA